MAFCGAHVRRRSPPFCELDALGPRLSCLAVQQEMTLASVWRCVLAWASLLPLACSLWNASSSRCSATWPRMRITCLSATSLLGCWLEHPPSQPATGPRPVLAAETARLAPDGLRGCVLHDFNNFQGMPASPNIPPSTYNL